MSADQRVNQARAYAAETLPRHDVLLPASVLIRMFYEMRRHVLALFDVIDHPADLRPAVLAGNYDLTAAEVATVLDALDVAADHKKDLIELCGECALEPDGGLCPTCSSRMDRVAEYDLLAEKMREHHGPPP